MNIQNPIRLAVATAGNRSKLARALGISPQAVRKYERLWDAGQAGAIPAVRAVQIEKAVGLDRHVMRPDLWPSPSTPREAA